MKAILINAKTKEVKEVEMGRDYKEIYTQLECELFTTGAYLDAADVIYVDDEGESTDCKVSFNEVKDKVKFYDRYELSLGIQMGIIKTF